MVTDWPLMTASWMATEMLSDLHGCRLPGNGRLLDANGNGQRALWSWTGPADRLLAATGNAQRVRWLQIDTRMARSWMPAEMVSEPYGYGLAPNDQLRDANGNAQCPL